MDEKLTKEDWVELNKINNGLKELKSIKERIGNYEIYFKSDFHSLLDVDVKIDKDSSMIGIDKKWRGLESFYVVEFLKETFTEQIDLKIKKLQENKENIENKNKHWLFFWNN